LETGEHGGDPALVLLGRFQTERSE